MKAFMKKAIAAMALALLLVTFLPISIQAKDLDEILNYTIGVDVNDDATVVLTYNIDWKVLDSTSEGPLEWVEIGIPNKHCISYAPISNNIKSMKEKHSGGDYVQVYFDRAYTAGEVVAFTFQVVMDNMYQYENPEGYCSYIYTPGWFDSIKVDEMVISWDADKADQWEPNCVIEDGRLVWRSPLNKGEKYTVKVVYPNDAYAFRQLEYDEPEEASLFEDIFTVIAGILCFGVIVAMGIGIVVVPVLIIQGLYKALRGFGGEKEITRTKIEYYASCPNCAGARIDESEKCAYCGTSMIKKKEVIKEKDIPKEEEKIRSCTKNGLYRYESDPNTYVRVHVVHVPRPTPPSRPSSSTRSSSSGSRSSCAHSSCACACACACAGGGRAGCSTKDFYNTNMKLRYLEYKKKRH